jgi:hypothetical protein
MTSFFAVVFRGRDKKAVADLQKEVAKTADFAISTATALQATLKELLDRKTSAEISKGAVRAKSKSSSHTSTNR